MQSSSYLHVDLSVIHNNLNLLTSAHENVMVMVKANAYGTDPFILSKFLKLRGGNIAFLGVSHVWEGVQLRESGINTPLFVISVPPYEAQWAAQYDLTCAVSTPEEVFYLNLAAQKLNKILPIHLHLDTGMHRFGASEDTALELYHTIQTSSHLYCEGAMTHFVAAESPEFDAFTKEQIRQFNYFLDSLPSYPKWVHAANSSGAVRFRIPFCNLVRIGLGFLGLGTCLEGTKPALCCTTPLASIQKGKLGESVGYNRRYHIKRSEEKIGVLHIGYHDGISRSLSGHGYVLVRGKKAPMIGTICMDFMMIDLTDIPEAAVGDEVTLFGTELSPELLADWGKTDVRELLAGLSPRIKRLWTNPPLIQSLRNADYGTASERLSGAFYPIEKDPSSR